MSSSWLLFHLLPTSEYIIMVRALQIYPELLECLICSDFFYKYSYGESWTHLVKNRESQFKKQRVPGYFVTTQLIWGQTPKLCITVYWNKNILLLLSSTTKTKRNKPCLTTASSTTATEITQTGYSTKTSSDR